MDQTNDDYRKKMQQNQHHHSQRLMAEKETVSKRGNDENNKNRVSILSIIDQPLASKRTDGPPKHRRTIEEEDDNGDNYIYNNHHHSHNHNIRDYETDSRRLQERRRTRRLESCEKGEEEGDDNSRNFTKRQKMTTTSLSKRQDESPSNSSVWRPMRTDDINRQLFVRNKPASMTMLHLVEFLNQAMKTVRLCADDSNPIQSCRFIPKSRWCILEVETSAMASKVLNLNGITVPGGQKPLEIVRHFQYTGKSEAAKNWEEVKAEFLLDKRRLYIGNLKTEIDEYELQRFLERTVLSEGLNLKEGSPVVKCEFVSRPSARFAIVEVRSEEEAERLLFLNGIPFRGVELTVQPKGRYLRSANTLTWQQWQERKRSQDKSRWLTTDDRSHQSTKNLELDWRLSREQDRHRGGHSNRKESQGDSSPKFFKGHSTPHQRSPRLEAVISRSPEKIDNPAYSRTDRKVEHLVEEEKSRSNEALKELKHTKDQLSRLQAEIENLKNNKYLEERISEERQQTQEFRRKYENLMVEYADLGKDFRRVSQSLAAATEHQRELHDICREEKSRRQSAEEKLMHAERELERTIQNWKREVEHLRDELRRRPSAIIKHEHEF